MVGRSNHPHDVSGVLFPVRKQTMKYFDMDLYSPDDNLFGVANILKENTVLDEVRVDCCGFEEKEDVVYFGKVVDAMKAN
jgi:hypothetical protein